MNDPIDNIDPIPAPATEPKFEYEVLCRELKIRGVIAYRTARVKLTEAEADSLNKIQPGSLKFLGI